MLHDPDPPATEPFPSQITVFCDECGDERTGDYLVDGTMTKQARLDVARRHLHTNEGWWCAPPAYHSGVYDDFCPDCRPRQHAPDHLCHMCCVAVPPPEGVIVGRMVHLAACPNTPGWPAPGKDTP